ncbi:acetyl-CoA acetyltransferase [Cytobacillus horneckiae]|uniref:Thiolase n=1 Tax=Cytobacillus horneckiae TaxID=549687 RepID=A0A2N0ZIS0_9BACI|nr:acetyl-CoA acetyltransferase [Cytobacillus horneckiae]MBN6886630.1 thiolase [Cytobacillus horneckiae]MEC1157294.1 acetyl-CoA acetyltransferase [Cytobacillus horneckiae]MED2935825.1 acetyl-CoA acetyltransferase [Cytobacillus horneckiae]PKG29410.1 thiolase [Cytobacillus horneckiae]
MSIKRSAAIVGVGDVELENGKVAGGKSVLQIQAIAAKRALDDAGLTKDDVDGMFVAGLWGLPGVGSFPSVVMSEYLGINPKFTDSTQIGGSAFEAHVGHAAAAIKAGLCEVALILYGSTQRSEKSRSLAGRPPTLTAQYETPFGLPSPAGSYAMAANRHMHEYGTTAEDLAEIAVATRKWAQLNPDAMMKDSLTINDVLNSPMICDPLHLLDCCLVTDGAGALVIVSPDRVKDCRKKPVWVLGQGESHSHWSIQAMPDLTVTSAAISGKTAFEMAGVTHDEIDFVQIYDSFTITVLLTLESLGFCKRGEGGDFVKNQRTAPGGDFPMNTNGGGLSYAHPGMYGIFLLIEAVRQLRNECGERQVQDAKIGLVNGTGGTLSSTSVVILGRD